MKVCSGIVSSNRSLKGFRIMASHSLTFRICVQVNFQIRVWMCVFCLAWLVDENIYSSFLYSHFMLLISSYALAYRITFDIILYRMQDTTCCLILTCGWHKLKGQNTRSHSLHFFLIHIFTNLIVTVILIHMQYCMYLEEREIERERETHSCFPFRVLNRYIKHQRKNNEKKLIVPNVHEKIYVVLLNHWSFFIFLFLGDDFYFWIFTSAFPVLDKKISFINTEKHANRLLRIVLSCGVYYVRFICFCLC